MEGLRELDKIAYVRFASVYRDFQDEAGFLQRTEELNAPEGILSLEAATTRLWWRK